MSHLSLETIARLVDEQPSALDSAHLDACAACRAELASMRSDIDALGDLPDVAPSPESWTEIEARLEAEGLLRPHRDVIPFASRTSRSNSRGYVALARAAAVAAIFAGGALVGHTVGASGPSSDNQVANTAAPANAFTPGSQVANVTPNTSVADPNATSTAGAAVNGNAPSLTSANVPTSRSSNPVRLASTGTDAQRNTARNTDTSGDASLRSLREAEDKYFSALSNYSVKAGTKSNDPNVTLAALEGIVLTTGAALAQAPTDPVINGYHLTALAQRDAMLKQIKANPAKSW